MLDGYLIAAVDLWGSYPVPATIGICVLAAGAFYLMAQS